MRREIGELTITGDADVFSEPGIDVLPFGLLLEESLVQSRRGGGRAESGAAGMGRGNWISPEGLHPIDLTFKFRVEMWLMLRG